MSGRCGIAVAALAMLFARGADGADGTDGTDGSTAGADLVVTQMLLGVTSLNFGDAVTIRNLGPDAAESGTLRFLSSDGLGVTGATVAVGAMCDIDGVGDMTCTLGTLAPNDEKTIFVNLHAQTFGTHGVTASTSSTTADPDLANNRDERLFQLTDVGSGGAGGAPGISAGGGGGCATAGSAGNVGWSPLWLALVAAVLIARRRR